MKKIIGGLLVFLAFAGLASAITCVDTDAKDIYTKGKVTYGAYTYTDSCYVGSDGTPNGRVKEYYCYSSSPRSGLYSCQYGCLDGHCQKYSVCGNGVAESTEQCDDDSSNGNVCTAGYGEECSYCSTECKLVNVNGGFCGDGVVQGTEECDNGLKNTYANGCSPSCSLDSSIGTTHTFSLELGCSEIVGVDETTRLPIIGPMVPDNDVTDGKMKLMFYSWRVIDPTGNITQSKSLTLMTDANPTISATQVLDKAGIWAFRAEKYYIDINWGFASALSVVSDTCDWDATSVNVN